MGKVTGVFSCFDGFPDDAGTIDQEVGYEFCSVVVKSVSCLLYSIDPVKSSPPTYCLMRDLHKSPHPPPQKTVFPKMATALFSETFENLQISTWCSHGNRSRTLKPSRRNMSTRILHSRNITCLHIELLWSKHKTLNHCLFEINLISSLFVLVVLSHTSKLPSR